MARRPETCVTLQGLTHYIHSSGWSYINTECELQLIFDGAPPRELESVQFGPVFWEHDDRVDCLTCLSRPEPAKEAP